MSETLGALRIRERELELEAVAVRARVEEVRSLIAILEQAEPRRPGRPRKIHDADADSEETAA